MKTVTLAAAFLASAVSAQYQIDPNAVNITIRDQWCVQQKTQCPLICLQDPKNTGTTLHNDCDPVQLTYECVCSDGVQPNVSEYSQTLPYFICTEWGNECVSNCGIGNSQCASDCRANHPCGAQNPTRVNTSTLTSSMASTAASASGSGQASSSSAFTGFGDSATTTTAGGNAAGVSTAAGATGFAASTSAHSGATAQAVRVWALSAGQTFGTLALAGAIFGGVAVLL